MAATTKAVRQRLILELLRAGPVRSQSQLSRLLDDRGAGASQGTLSKDLLELGAVRCRDAQGQLIYLLASDGAAGSGEPSAERKLGRLGAELMVAVDASGNLVLAQTLPGAAQYLAAAVDRVAWPEVLGCVAGDDSVLIITRQPLDGPAVADRLRDITGPTEG